MTFFQNEMHAKSETREWFDLYLVNGAVSDLLVNQIDNFIENRTTNVWAIYDEIALLEGHPNAKPTRTKRADVFKGSLLRGFWHKHYYTSTMGAMLQNIEQYWRRNNRFDRMIDKEFAGKSFTADEAAKILSYRFVMDGHSFNREKTGEWIVFAKQNSHNYYLTLANHKEKNDAIWRRCKACADEFPMLEILKERRDDA